MSLLLRWQFSQFTDLSFLSLFIFCFQTPQISNEWYFYSLVPVFLSMRLSFCLLLVLFQSVFDSAHCHCPLFIKSQSFSAFVLFRQIFLFSFFHQFTKASFCPTTSFVTVFSLSTPEPQFFFFFSFKWHSHFWRWQRLNSCHKWTWEDDTNRSWMLLVLCLSTQPPLPLLFLVCQRRGRRNDFVKAWLLYKFSSNQTSKKRFGLRSSSHKNHIWRNFKMLLALMSPRLERAT